MISFEEARAIVEAYVSPRWAGPGALAISKQGFEDDRAFRVLYGPDPDPGPLEWMDDSVALVDKRTGALIWTTYLSAPDRFDSMEPVSV